MASARDYYFSGGKSGPSVTGVPTSNLPGLTAWDEYFNHGLRAPESLRQSPEWRPPGSTNWSTFGQPVVDWLKTHAKPLVPYDNTPPGTPVPGNETPKETVTPPGLPSLVAGDPRVTRPPGRLPAAIPDAVYPAEKIPTQADLDNMLLQAQIDNLTSTADKSDPDYTGLEAAAEQLKDNKWESLMRFGFATAAARTPHFGVAVGAGGLAMMDSRDEGLNRYNVAVQNIAQLKETSRSNRQTERTQALEVAKPPARGGATNNPALDSLFNSAEKRFEQLRTSIMDPENMDYPTPEDRQAAMESLEVERQNFYAQWGLPVAPMEIDLADSG